jgi:hypothetical protein
VAETAVRRLLCCGYRRTGKAMGQVCQCWLRICREMNVFPRFNYHMSHVLYRFVTSLLTLPRKMIQDRCFKSQLVIDTGEYRSSEATVKVFIDSNVRNS